MFGKRKVRRDDRGDWMHMDNGQQFALFKKLGGQPGVDRVLQGHGALSAIAEGEDVAPVHTTVTCKFGVQVTVGFWTNFERWYANEWRKQKQADPLRTWARDVLADDTLESCEVELCLPTIKQLTGHEKVYNQDRLRLMRYPYSAISVEWLMQIAIQVEGGIISDVFPPKPVLEPTSFLLGFTDREWVSWNSSHDKKLYLSLVTGGTQDGSPNYSSSKYDQFLVMRTPHPFHMAERG